MTVLNISLFVFMIFENQLDLIIENSILNSQISAGQFQFALENLMEESREWSDDKSEPLIRESRAIGLDQFTLFDEEGSVLLHVFQGEVASRSPSSMEELRQINTAITRRAFENKLLSQRIQDSTRNIELYIPFSLSRGRQGVALLVREMTNISEQMVLLYRQCLIVAFIIFLIHGGFAVFIGGQIFSPLRALLSGARSISAGNLETRVSVVRHDEIGELASAFNEMSVAIRNMHDEARGANPLTGLPGNITIAKAIDKRLKDGVPFAVLYCDMDNFKAYNDKYGFTRGDDAIIFTKECLLKTKEYAQESEVFIGHEGGDDFVLITPYEQWKSCADFFLNRFDAGVAQFYNKTDAQNGFIESVNRQGQPMRFPLMSISIAVVSNRYRDFAHHAELVQVAAEIKKIAKKKDGSFYVEDTRGINDESGVLVKVRE